MIIIVITLKGEIKQRKIKKTVKAGEKEYNSLDPIYKKPHSPATIYVGDRHAASDINLLKRFRITSVVNCTRPAESGELPNYCQGTYIKYYEFPIATWSHYLFPNKSRDEWLSDKASTPQELAKVRDFFQRMFQFIQEALDRNESVLIHCLAGAHRAGSCGVAVLMYFLDLELAKAVFLAKLCRPIIDPIGSLPKVLMLLEEELKSKRKKNEMGGSFSQKVGSDVPLSRRQSFDKKSFDTENGTGQLRKVKSADQLKDEFNFNAGGGDIKLAPIFEPRKGSSKYKGKMLRASIDIAALGFLKEDNTISRFDRAMDQVKKLDSSLPNIGTKTLPNISTSNDNDIKFPSLTLKRVQSNKF